MSCPGELGLYLLSMSDRTRRAEGRAWAGREKKQQSRQGPRPGLRCSELPAEAKVWQVWLGGKGGHQREQECGTAAGSGPGEGHWQVAAAETGTLGRR